MLFLLALSWFCFALATEDRQIFPTSGEAIMAVWGMLIMIGMVVLLSALLGLPVIILLYLVFIRLRVRWREQVSIGWTALAAIASLLTVCGALDLAYQAGGDFVGWMTAILTVPALGGVWLAWRKTIGIGQVWRAQDG